MNTAKRFDSLLLDLDDNSLAYRGVFCNVTHENFGRQFQSQRADKSAFFMSLVGISEGAIPFAANDPLRVIPCLMVGTSIGTAMAYALGVTTKAAWGGFIVLPVSTNIPGYIASAMVGSVIGALLLNFVRKPPEEAPPDSGDDDDVDAWRRLQRRRKLAASIARLRRGDRSALRHNQKNDAILNKIEAHVNKE